MSQLAAKRKRNVLTIETKLKIVERMENGESVAVLARHYNIGKQTVRDIFRDKNKLTQFVMSSDTFNASSSRKTLKPSSMKELDQAVYKWFTQKRSEGQPISGPMLLEKALWFHQQLNIQEQFNASQGWLQRFKSRHGVRQLDIQGEKLSADADAANSYIAEFKQIVAAHSLTIEQIYNADETGLLWKALPSKTLVSYNEKSAPGHKSSKERITIMACSNISGSHKLKLLCIGKAKKPRSFKGTEMQYFPVDYYNQKKAWMNQAIFEQWFFQKFVPAVREHLCAKGLPEKAMLLLDNAPSHPSIDILKTEDGNIFVTYLPPNVTSLIQPMDQGILETFKRRYRKSLLRAVLQDDNDLKSFYKKWTIKDAMYSAAESWSEITPITLRKSWRKLFPDRVASENDIINEDSVQVTTESLMNIAQNVNGFEGVDRDDLEAWMKIDEEDPGYEIKDDSAIVLETLGIASTDDDSDEESVTEDSAIKKISFAEALSCSETLLEYLEQQDNTNYNEIISVRKIRMSIKEKLVKNKRQSLMTDFFKK